MIIFIVFVVVVAAIGLAAYGGSMVHDPITYIPDEDCDICGYPLDGSDCEVCGIARIHCRHPNVDLSVGQICDKCGAGMQGGMSL